MENIFTCSNKVCDYHARDESHEILVKDIILLSTHIPSEVELL